MSQRYEVTAVGLVDVRKGSDIDATLDGLMERLVDLGGEDPFVGFAGTPEPDRAEIEVVLSVVADSEYEALSMGRLLIGKAMEGIIEGHGQSEPLTERAELIST